MSKLNVKPRTLFCNDNMVVLPGINSGCIDLIYLDPPFNKNKVFTAPIGSSAEGAEFSDIFREEDMKDEWVKSIEYENPELHSFLSGVKLFGGKFNYCYLVYMSIRLIECHRALKDTGSVYLHCDPGMSHYLKIVLDCVFGEGNFKNEIVWNYGKWSNVTKNFQRNHDIILFYGKNARRAVFNPLYVAKKSDVAYHTNIVNGRGQLLIYKKDETPADVIKKYAGKGYSVVYVSNEGVLENDTWTSFKHKELNIINSQSKERTGYPTQKPLALLERIISASSNKGDVVLDPFCGCATTCVAAEKLGRQWIGVDVSRKARELVNMRLEALYSEQGDKSIAAPLLGGGRHPKVHYTMKPPKRGRGDYQEQGYVYIISNANWQGIYKVGIAKDPQRRLNGYQTSDPYRAYKLEYSIKTPCFRELEAAIHKKFNAANEWVRADYKKLKQEIARVEKKLRG